MSDAHNDIISNLSEAASLRYSGYDFDDWLTVPQAAQRLNLPESIVQQRCESGQLKAHLLTTENGTAWYINPASLPAGEV